MSTTNIQLLRSNIVSKRPAASVLLDGQVAVNYNFQEPGLFFRLTNGQLTKVGPVAYSNDGSFPNAVPAGEPGNAVGEQWLDARLSYASPLLKVYDGTDWVLSNGFEVNDATGDLSIDRDITVNQLNAKTLNLSESLTLSEDLLAKDNCVQNIGAELKRFQQAWFCTADVLNNLYVGGDIIGVDLILTQDIVARKATFSSDLIVGSSEFNKLSVDGTLDVLHAAELKGGLTVGFDLLATGDTVLGTNCANTLTVSSTSTFNCAVTFKEPVIFDKQPVFPSGGLVDAILNGNTVIGDACATSTLTIKAATSVECDILPSADSTINLGSETMRFANVYTGDLHLRNERGSWTMVEEDAFLTLRNNKSGKTYRILMEEV
jgi:hypothetical protein